MMTLIKIAFRNLLRNGRRSFMTIAAIAVGCASLLCFGQFIGETLLEFRSSVIESGGHLAVFRKGYFDFGAGNPSAYGIPDYKEAISEIRGDPVLQPLVNVVTPTVNLFGIAGNYAADTSKTVFGVGVVPSDSARMMRWDEYGLYTNMPPPPIEEGLSDADENAAVIGIGVARVLGLCGPLHVSGCPAPPPSVETSLANGPSLDPKLAALGEQEGVHAAPAGGPPHIDLLTATTQGAPNVASLVVRNAVRKGSRDVDDSYVGLHFNQAQKLLYGRDTPQATAIIVQLRHTEDVKKAQERIRSLFSPRKSPLEVLDFRQLNSFYTQSETFLQTIFDFLALIMGVIVLFTVANTTSMAVLERIDEIGTARALGAQRNTIRLQFLLEGSMLGGTGALVGLILAESIGLTLNAMRIPVYIPGSSSPGRLILLTSGAAAPLMIGVTLGLILIAVVASVLPANKAAKMPIVDALRHV